MERTVGTPPAGAGGLIDPAETVLLVSSFAGDHARLRQILLDSTWQLNGLFTCREALEYVRAHSVPVVICEPLMSDGVWADFLGAAAPGAFPPSIIVAARAPDERLWAEVLHMGGCDVVQAPFEPGETLYSLAAARRNWDSRRHRAIARCSGSGC